MTDDLTDDVTDDRSVGLGPAPFAAGDSINLGDRLAAVSIDDSTETLDDASIAALAVVDLGVRLLGETDEEAVTLVAARAVGGRVASLITATPVTSSERLSRDPRARRAFVLGGPDAVTALGSE